MENSEEVLQILERFTKLKQKDIPKELEDYLCFVAKTGDTVYRWANVKYLFREKLMNVIKDFHDSTQSIDDLPQYPNVDPFNYETMKSALLERLEVFNAAPFTIQRLCELLTDPRKQYSRIDKYMRALEKNILVVSTVEPGRKQPESENGDSLDSVVNGDISLDVNVDIDMENESIFRMEAQNTSSSSSASSSSNKSEDSGASEPKRFKVDNTEDNSSDKSKSGSDSDESSDDSDNQTPVEVPKDRHPSEPSNCEIPTSDLTIKENIESEHKENHKQDQTESLSTENDAVISNKEQIEPNSTNNDTSTEEVEKKADETEQKSNEQPLKVDSQVSAETEEHDEPPPEKSTEDIQVAPQETPKTESLEPKNTEESTEPIVKAENGDLVPEESSSPGTTEFAVQKSEVENQPPPVSEEPKISEEMSIEEPQVSSTTGSQETAPVAVAHQPMEENVEPELPPTCTADAASMNEVVMQTETEMTTEPMKIIGEEKADQGMEVDDTSQEAMDQ